MITRAGDVELHRNARFSGWTDVWVPLATPISVEEHILFEGHAHEDVGGFVSMPLLPLGSALHFTVRNRSQGAPGVTEQVDTCISAVNQVLGNRAL